MQLDPFVRDYRGFMVELVGAVEAEATVYYLDTSLLMWLLHVASRVRAEFIRWCETRPANAVRVPVWAAHELHRHLVSNTVRASVQKTLSDTEAKVDEFARLASERADEATCLAKGFAGRASYVSQVEQTRALFVNLKRVVEPDEGQLRQAAEEVIAVVNAYVLASDIRPVVAELSLTGDFRYRHRIPPGFQDKKEENRYGDVIIWEEIVGDLLAANPDPNEEPRRSILISRDDKTDWVSSAPFVLNLNGVTQRADRGQELDVTLAHPLLIHDLANRVHDNRIYITTPGFLASVLDFSARQSGRHYDISQWLAASCRPNVLSRFVPPSPTPPAIDHELAFEGEDAVSVMSASATEELRRYWEAVPLEQPVLLSDWVTQLCQGKMPPFKFGRLLAQLSINGSSGWPEQIPAVVESLNTITGESLNAFVLALITSAYFDRHGQLLRRPHRDLGQIVLPLETEPRLKPAFNSLNRFLADAGAILPYPPGAGRKPVAFELDLVPSSSASTIRGIRIGGHSALVVPVSADNRRRLSALLPHIPPENCTGQELRMLIALEYIIPPDLLPSTQDRRKLAWSTDAGLVALDSGSEGGLSALADEEDEND